MEPYAMFFAPNGDFLRIFFFFFVDIINSDYIFAFRSDTPYQLMEYSGFLYPNDIVNRNSSYLTRSEVLEYMHSFADHFNLTEHIKFNHLVLRVRPIENDRWEIITKDLPNDKYMTETFDAVFVCNGHYSEPNLPQIEGANAFKGKQIHSHDYRSTDPFRGKL